VPSSAPASKELTGSSAWAGLVFFCYIAGNLFSPLGGVLADRFPRRPLLVVANLLTAPIVLPIALVHWRGDIWIVYVVIFLYGVTGSVIKAAQSALAPRPGTAGPARRGQRGAADPQPGTPTGHATGARVQHPHGRLQRVGGFLRPHRRLAPQRVVPRRADHGAGRGAVLAGMAAAPLLTGVSEPVLLAMGLGCLTLAMLALTVPDLVVVLVGMVVAGFVGPWLSVAGVTAFQRRTPAAIMGRVFGVLRLALTIPQAASIGIGAALITVLNYRVLLAVIAVAAATSGLFVIVQPGIWRRAVPGTVGPTPWRATPLPPTPARQSDGTSPYMRVSYDEHEWLLRLRAKQAALPCSRAPHASTP
jgi:MFS family permease